ncbi:MAG: PAS domain-containing sensor histidine kinase, partial [Sphingomonas sp.]
MTLIDHALPVVRGLVDRDGRLVSADARLAELNARAGGAIGAPLAIPQLAALARLALRLETPISRAILAADGDHDIDLWVQVEPGDEGARLALTGWRPRPNWVPAGGERTHEGDFARDDADWLWETDGALHLTYLSVAHGAHDGGDLDSLLGQPLTRLFALDTDKHGDLPMLRALSLRQRCEDQAATLRASGRPVRLSAIPRLDPSGGFAGLIGAARLLAPDAESPAPTAPPDAFSARLDKALRAPLSAIIANAETIHAQSDGALPTD